MASPPPGTGKALVSQYYSSLRDSVVRIVPSPSAVSALLARLFGGLYPPYSLSSKIRRRKSGLPLPFRAGATLPSSVLNEPSAVLSALDDIFGHILSNLHEIQKNLQFWQSRAEGTDAQKAHFLMFERGPWALFDETIHMIRRQAKEGSSIQHLCYSAAASISEKISLLTSLKHCLATFLAQVYIEVSKHGEQLSKDSGKALPSLLVAIDSLFSSLETSIIQQNDLHKINSPAISFESLQHIGHERLEWSQTSVRDATHLIHQNVQRLDSYISIIVSKCQKPRKMTLYWIRYTCGAVGFSMCAIWILRHSRLMGSSDIDNWLHEAKESTLSFWKGHVELPLLSIRDELFETFRRHKAGVIEVEEVKLTENSLHRMLLAFSEQTKGEKFPENASEQEMLEIVMSRYEKEVLHPIQNLFSGEIAHALLIQIQKLKLDLETAMLELDQILKANEINFAILAALPAFFVSVILLMLSRAWLLRDNGAEGRGRIARLQRRLLVVEIERKIMRFQACMDQGLEEDAQCMFGLVLYTLDCLYKAAEKHASETGEWLSLRQDILDIGNPEFRVENKLILTSRMQRLYECMLPSLKHH